MEEVIDRTEFLSKLRRKKNGRLRMNDFHRQRIKVERKKEAFTHTKLYREITTTIYTDDWGMVECFREMLEEARNRRREDVSAHNNAVDELLGQFVFERSKFIRALRRAGDPNDVPRFDELVQYVRDHPEIEGILGGSGDDIEDRIFTVLKEGKRRLPTINSLEVWEDACEEWGDFSMELQRSLF